jgi:hypothetical protein
MEMEPWTTFRSHFEANARRPLPDTSGAHGVPDHARAEVTASLARFQLGESGEGRIAHEIDRFHSRAIDDDYRAALKLFVKEEARHAIILGSMVRSLGGALLEKTWTETLFVAGRRILGVRLKLLVLLAAEVVGIGFYRAIGERLGDGCVRSALLQICADEETHLEFHRAFFLRSAPSGWARMAFLAAWALIGGAACAVVLLDHRRTLRVLEVPLTQAARTLVALLIEAAIAQREPRGLSPGNAPQGQALGLHLTAGLPIEVRR